MKNFQKIKQKFEKCGNLPKSCEETVKKSQKLNKKLSNKMTFIAIYRKYTRRLK